MTTWVLGKTGVAPVKNPKSRKRRNPKNLLSNEEKKTLRKWASQMRRRRNPRRRNLVPEGAGGGAAWAGWREEIGAEDGERARMADVFAGLGRGARKLQRSQRRKKKKGVTKAELLKKAKRYGIPCRTQMTKRQLQYHIRKAEEMGGPYLEGRRAKWGQCRPKKRKSSRKKSTKKRKISKASKRGASKKRGRRRATTWSTIGRKNPQPSWWSRLLPGDSGASEDKVFKNPRGSKNMAKRKKRVSFSKNERYGGHLGLFKRGGKSLRRGAKPRRLSVRFLNNPKRKRRKKRRKNPMDIRQDLLGGISYQQAAIIGGSLAVLCLAENALQNWGVIDLSSYGRLATAGSKLAIGLGGAWGAEKAGLLDRGSDTSRMFRIAAIASALGDLAKAACNNIYPAAMEALGLGYAVGPQDYILGETVANPADQGSVVLSNGALGYAVGPQDYMLGETVANPASQGAVVTTGLGELSYNPHGLGGGFYAGNVSLPKQSGEHPDFMNQVPGRPDLSAVPDFMR